MADDEKISVLLVAEEDANGGAVCEHVPVSATEEPGCYVLEASPALILNLAAGDTIRLQERGRFSLVKRGGNVCVQVFRESNLRTVEAFLTPRMRAIGGRKDVEEAKVIVYTVPVAVGFSRIEAAMASTLESFTDIEWIYGNVYDPVDGVTPLGWWKG